MQGDGAVYCAWSEQQATEKTGAVQQKRGRLSPLFCNAALDLLATYRDTSSRACSLQ